MSNFDPSHLPPPPGDIEGCHKEILYLQRQLFLVREQIAKKIVQRELDFRSLKGLLSQSVDENNQLRRLLSEANAAKNGIATYTPSFGGDH